VFRVNEKKQQLAYLYVDGKPLTGVSHNALAGSTPPKSDRAVALGGDGTAAFDGLIDDARVWGTWLHAAEIMLRKNTKLAGTEPDLLAAWTFSANAVHDASMSGLNATETQDLDLWLTDLSFVRPSYPYLTASSQGVEIDEAPALEGHGTTIKTAIYATKIAMRDAHGSPRAGTIKVWASEPTDISTKAKPAAQPVNTTKFAEFKVGADGKLDLKLSCKDLEHSPVLWIWADFMYENERFHVSPAVESQHVVKAPPPKLIAQSTMIQDFDYTSGDTLGKNTGKGKFTLNKNVDVTTIRTTITAETNAGQPIPNESLEVWSNEHLTIEVNGKPYEVNTDNSARFKTDSQGTLTVVIKEDGTTNKNLLNTPELRVRAGWMPRSQRAIFSPAENQHQTLSKVDADQVMGDKQLDPTKPKQTLITKLKDSDPSGAKAKAPAIASTLKQMASAAKKHEPVSPHSAGDARSLIMAPSGAQNPNPALMPADHVSVYHTLTHIEANAPITPEYMPAKNFVFSLHPDGKMTHKLCETEEELDAHLASLSLPDSQNLFICIDHAGGDDPAGGWFKSIGHAISHAWHAVEHGVEKAWHAVTHFVVKTWDEIKHDVGQVIHQVEVVVADAAKAIGKWIVKTVKDVVDHIVGFLKKIWVVLKEIYEFLRALLDWKGILETRDLIENTFNHFLDIMETVTTQTIPKNLDSSFVE